MDLLATAAPKSGPGWLQPLRELARRSLDEQGLPTRKSEAWRFTRVDHLTSADYADAPLEASMGWAPLSSHWRALVRAGEITCGPNVPSGLTVHRLADVPPDLAAHLGTIADNQHFVALNSAGFADVLVLHVAGHVETPVEIEYEAAGTQPSYPRVLVVLERGACLQLVERTSGQSTLTVAVTEVVLGDGARLDHVRVHEDSGAFLGTVAAAVGRDAYYGSHVFTFGGGTSRMDLSVRLQGAGAEARLDGMYLVEATEHVDHHVRVDHIAPHSSSRQCYRGVLDGKGTAVFDGQSIVHRTAPGCEAHQENRNLLLSDRANVFTKPHLEIDHDDVVASHGATVGALDVDQLFYLRSRGVPQPVARAVLTFAFLRELVDRVPIAALHAELVDGLLARLPESDMLRDEPEQP